MMGNKHTMSGTGANVSGELVTRSPVWLLGRGYPMDSLGHQVTEPLPSHPAHHLARH